MSDYYDGGHNSTFAEDAAMRADHDSRENRTPDRRYDLNHPDGYCPAGICTPSRQPITGLAPMRGGWGSSVYSDPFSRETGLVPENHPDEYRAWLERNGYEVSGSWPGTQPAEQPRKKILGIF